MREIKFRKWDLNWDGSMPQMQYSDNSEHALGLYAVHILDKGSDFGYAFMQYTGLKDSDGVEIYENDIVNCSSGVVGYADLLNGVVNYHNGCFRVTFKTKNGTTHKRVSVITKVIGNIHEHPELVKQ